MYIWTYIYLYERILYKKLTDTTFHYTSNSILLYPCFPNKLFMYVYMYLVKSPVNL